MHWDAGRNESLKSFWNVRMKWGKVGRKERREEEWRKMERERKREREERKRGREGEKQLLNINFPVKTLANNQTKPILFSWAQESLWMVIAAMKLRHLLLGIKAMTTLDRILKGRDIILPTKVHLVKAMIFQYFLSAQFNSVAQPCPTLCDPMNCSTQGFPVIHQLLEFTQTHVHWFGDAIQPSHPLASPSPPAFRVFSNESALWVRWPKYWSFSISPSNEYSVDVL